MKVVITIIAVLLSIGFGMMVYGSKMEWNMVNTGMAIVLLTLLYGIIWVVWYAITSEKKIKPNEQYTQVYSFRNIIIYIFCAFLFYYA